MPEIYCYGEDKLYRLRKRQGDYASSKCQIEKKCSHPEECPLVEMVMKINHMIINVSTNLSPSHN